MSGKSFTAFMGVLAVIALLAFGVFAKGEGRLDVGDDAPDTELEVLNQQGPVVPGETFSVGDFEGKWVLLNVWASWCNPCRDEAPELQAFQDEHGGDDFTVLGINTQDASPDALEFVDEFGLTYTSVRDGSGDYAQEELGTTGVPESFLVDPQGKIAAVFPGQITQEDLDGVVAPLIEGEEPA